MDDERRFKLGLALSVVSWACILVTIWFVVDIMQNKKPSVEMIGVLWSFIWAALNCLTVPVIGKVEKNKEKKDQETVIEVEVKDVVAGNLGRETEE